MRSRRTWARLLSVVVFLVGLVLVVAVPILLLFLAVCIASTP